LESPGFSRGEDVNSPRHRQQQPIQLLDRRDGVRSEQFILDVCGELRGELAA